MPPPTTIPNLKPLLLAGGQSSRMGSAKFKMPFTDGKPLFWHLIQRLQEACPHITTLYMSLHDPAQLSGVELPSDTPIEMVYDEDDNSDFSDSVGPAAGLLAAHKKDPSATWLVLACDYPLMNVSELVRLLEAYQEPLTCFENAEGWSEPLVSIWGPEALKQLESNVRNGRLGPKNVVKAVGKTIRAGNEQSLFNTNTRAEWERALEIARGKQT